MTQPPVRTGACPSCGAPVSFALASSVVAVCGYCRFAVARTDRDLRLVGKVADLVPTTPEAAIGDEGNVAGHRFRVFGRLQIDHGRGPWDEWYVALENGGWGWLARAQGRWYATSPAPYAPGSAPDYARAVAGTRLELAGQTWVVAERGRSRMLSAEGELPLPVRVGEEGRYLDLSGPAGAFATLDYGDGSEPPRLYVGRVVPAEQVRFTMRAAGPRPAHVVETARLRCPSCGAPVELFVPDRAERRTCGHCNALLDVEHGELRYLKHLEPRPVRPTIPIGARGTLRGEAVVCTGFMLRSVVEDGEWFQWTEYLLWTPAGYRWLTEDARGHFHLYRPIEIGDVVVDGHQAFVGDRRFRLHTSGDVAPAHVDHVQGEFYWRVEVGDTSRLDDYVAPPEALGIERTQDEIHAALGTWVDPHELWRAFGLSGPPPRPSGTGLAQPAPSARWPWIVSLVGLLLFAVVELGYRVFSPAQRTIWIGRLPLAPAGAGRGPIPAPPATGGSGVVPVVYTPPFDLVRSTTLRVHVAHDGTNDAVLVAVALVDQHGGGVREAGLVAERYSGREGGESWVEGTAEADVLFDRVRAGRYVMRFETSWEPFVGALRASHVPSVHARVVEGADPLGACWPWMAGLMLLPGIVGTWRRMSRERGRWATSNVRHALGGSAE